MEETFLKPFQVGESQMMENSYQIFMESLTVIFIRVMFPLFFSRSIFRLGVVAHIFNSSTRETLSQGDLGEFKASLMHTGHSRPPRVTQ